MDEKHLEEELALAAKNPRDMREADGISFLAQDRVVSFTLQDDGSFVLAAEHQMRVIRYGLTRYQAAELRSFLMLHGV